MLAKWSCSVCGLYTRNQLTSLEQQKVLVRCHFCYAFHVLYKPKNETEFAVVLHFSEKAILKALEPITRDLDKVHGIK